MKSKVVICKADIMAAESKVLLNNLSDCLEKITGNSGKHSFNEKEIDNNDSIFVVARMGGKAVGCGACRKLDDTTVELKRVYAGVSRAGIGTGIITYLEEFAREKGYQKAVLETRKVNRAAVEFYMKNGYHVIDNYGNYKGREEAVCFEKILI